jgi:hypothetical protein
MGIKDIPNLSLWSGDASSVTRDLSRPEAACVRKMPDFRPEAYPGSKTLIPGDINTGKTILTRSKLIVSKLIVDNDRMLVIDCLSYFIYSDVSMWAGQG